MFAEGITRLTPQDLAYAEELGYRIKHLGVAKHTAKGVELRVHPTLIPEQQLLANVNGVKNAVLVEGNAVGSTLYYGAGAGAEPTASAVVADIVDLARDLAVGQQPQLAALGVKCAETRTLPIVPMAEIETPWYLRLEADDKPGVMSQVTSLLSAEGISIEALIQKAPLAGQTKVPVVVLTNTAAQGRLDKAVSAIESLDSISSDIMCIRVETLQA